MSGNLNDIILARHQTPSGCVLQHFMIHQITKYGHVHQYKELHLINRPRFPQMQYFYIGLMKYAVEAARDDSKLKGPWDRAKESPCEYHGHFDKLTGYSCGALGDAWEPEVSPQSFSREDGSGVSSKFLEGRWIWCVIE
jgi:hypothetical protein